MSGSQNRRPPGRQAWAESDRPVPRLVIRPLAQFLQTESAGSVLLLLATLMALIWVNSPWAQSYEQIWHTQASIRLGEYEVANDLRHWINDGLMAVFFFVVGLELKRELLDGELRHPRKAALPAIAALGGMLLPALIYFLLNRSGEAASGWGIPMATDIAFALGALAFCPGVPSSLKTFLLTLAIVDDIGAIAVIALFYSRGLAWQGVGLALVLLLFILAVRRFHERWQHLDGVRVASQLAYGVLGLGVWLAILESGVHATLAGVALALCVRADSATNSDLADLDEDLPQIDEELSPAERLEHSLHPLTSYGIIPLFALANAGIEIRAETLSAAANSSVTLGVVLGLVVGKIAGISLFSLAAVRMRIGLMPEGVTSRHIMGAAALAGIGFTVSLFITGLAFDQSSLEADSKLGVMVGSLIAAAIGTMLLRRANKQSQELPS